MYSVSYRRSSYTKVREECQVCFEKRIMGSKKCGLCKKHVCYEGNCILSFDFFIGKEICGYCVKKLGKVI
jgi:hypothetical protein